MYRVGNNLLWCVVFHNGVKWLERHFIIASLLFVLDTGVLELISPEYLTGQVGSSHLISALSFFQNIEILTWMLFPVSGVVPSNVRMISNFSPWSPSLRSSGLTAHSGEISSILWASTSGQNSWKKSWLPSRSVPNSMAQRWCGISSPSSVTSRFTM